MAVAQAVEGVSESRCPLLPRAIFKATYAFTQMSLSSTVELFIASTKWPICDLLPTLKALCDKDGNKESSLLKVKYDDLLKLSKELMLCVSPYLHLPQLSAPCCNFLLTVADMAVSHRSPAESPHPAHWCDWGVLLDHMPPPTNSGHHSDVLYIVWGY